MKRLFCDVNIFQDILSGRKGFEASLLILELVRQRHTEGFLASFSVPILWYLNQKAERPREKIRTVIKGFSVVPLTQKMVTHALSAEGRGDLEDELQSLCAQQSRSTFLITRNTRDFQPSKITVLTPEEYLKSV